MDIITHGLFLKRFYGNICVGFSWTSVLKMEFATFPLDFQVITVLQDMTGTYPLPQDEVSTAWNLTPAITVALLKLKPEALLEFAPMHDILGDETHVLALDQSGLSLSHPKFYEDQARVGQLRDVIRVIGTYLDLDESQADKFAWKAIRYFL